MKILLLATILATVEAYCPNACSGHGSCGINGELLVSDQLNPANRFLSFFDVLTLFVPSLFLRQVYVL